MTETKFNVGDRVRVKDCSFNSHPILRDQGITIGDVGTILAVDQFGCVKFRSDGSGPATGFWGGDRFELIPSPETVDFDTAWKPGNEIEFTVRGKVSPSGNWLVGHQGGLSYSDAKKAGQDSRILSSPPPKPVTVELTRGEAVALKAAAAWAPEHLNGKAAFSQDIGDAHQKLDAALKAQDGTP